MSYFGCTMCHASLNKTVILGCIFAERRRGRIRKNWMDNILEWAGSEMDLTQLIEDTRNRGGWRRTCVAAIHIPPTINRSRD